MILFLSALALAAGPTGAVCAGPLEHGMDAPRPELSGPVESVDVDAAFRLHFTAEGDDAVKPELVDWAGAEWSALSQAWADSPWRALVGDDGTGGSPAIDGYFVSIEANGYANPITPVEGASGHSCFIRIDPDIHRLGEVVARSIVRHELAHCVQYRYTADSDSWLYEAGATYEQYRPAPDEAALRLLTNALWAERISQPDRALDDLGTGLVRFEYSGFIWFKYLEEAGVSPWTVWEALEEAPRWRPGLDLALDGELAVTFLEHAWANQHACGRAGPVQAYAPAPAGCTAPVEAPREVADGASVIVPRLAAWTSATWQVPRPAGDDPVQLQVACDTSEGLLGVLVDNGASETISDATDGAVGAGAVSPGGSALVVVGGFGSGVSTGTCDLTWIPARADSEPESGGCSGLSAGGLWLWPWGALLLFRRRTA